MKCDSFLKDSFIGISLIYNKFHNLTPYNFPYISMGIMCKCLTNHEFKIFGEKNYI